MTCYRKGLYPLTPFSREEAAAVVAQVEMFAEGCLSCYGERIFFAADELYIAAGLPLPDADYYEGFRQLENGVGMMASWKGGVRRCALAGAGRRAKKSGFGGDGRRGVYIYPRAVRPD